MKFVFGGGGTGGHVVPALALANELQARGHQCSFIGNANSVEQRLCKENGYHIDFIRVQKLYRSLKASNLLFPYYLVRSMLTSVSLLKRIKPHAVICTGGFVSGPVAIATALLRLPLFFHENNSYPGLVTRFMHKRIDTIFTSFPGTQMHLPHAHTECLGIPLLSKPRHEFDMNNIGLDRVLPTILVSGGSQGSMAINSVIDEALPEIIALGFQVIWQTGAYSYQKYALKHSSTPGVHLFAFSPLLPAMMAKAAFAITRAGAMTIAELEQNRIPAIMIPLPTAAENHQYYNAQEQQRKGAALVLPQNRLNKSSLMAAIISMKTESQLMRERMQNLPPNNASREIVNSLLAYLNKHLPTNQKEF